MPQEICDRAVNGARKWGPHWPIARINPALKLQPRETPLKQLLFLIYARCDYVIKLEQSCALLAPFNVVFAGVFVPVPPKKKAMRTVLVLPKTRLGEGKEINSHSFCKLARAEPKALVVRPVYRRTLVVIVLCNLLFIAVHIFRASRSAFSARLVLAVKPKYIMYIVTISFSYHKASNLTLLTLLK